MKVALVYLSNYHDWPMGGMLNYVNNIIPSLCKMKELDVEIWGGTRGKKRDNKFYIDGEEYTFNRYTSFYTQHKILPNFLLSFLGALIYSYKFRKYDIIFSQTSATTIALKLTHPLKCVIHQQHGFSYKDRPGLPRKVLCVGHLFAQLIANATLFVADAEDIEKHRREHKCLKSKHFYAIGSPIKYRLISEKALEDKKKAKKGVRFIYTGRIDAWKNIELMVDAFEMYLEEGFLGELTLIGDGPQLEMIRQKAFDSKYSQFIHVEGRKDFSQIIDFLSENDVFLFPTRGEGISLSLLEAFAAGLPAVAFDVKGVTSFVKNNISGVIVSNMTISDFKNGMIQISSNYSKMRSNCMTIASEFESETIAQKISEIILKEAYEDKD